MKYPGLGPAGGPGGSGWAWAGSDLVLAADLLRDPGDALGRVRLAEVLRRRFEIDGALAVLRATGPEPTIDELLCLGTVHWTVGDAAAAVGAFASAARQVATVGDDDGRLAAAIGLARAERVSARPTSTSWRIWIASGRRGRSWAGHPMRRSTGRRARPPSTARRVTRTSRGSLMC